MECNFIPMIFELQLDFQKRYLTLLCTLDDTFVPPKTISINITTLRDTKC